MSRFCLSRKWISGFSMFSLLIGGTCLVTPSASYADTSWADILKPLVKDVIVPGANAGMKKLLEKKLKVKIDPSDTSQMMDADSNLNSNDSVMSMPEEPTASSSTSNTDSVMSMPEEPTYSASTGSSGSTLSAPPPPVSTP